jgi:hypothetical protein
MGPGWQRGCSRPQHRILLTDPRQSLSNFVNQSTKPLANKGYFIADLTKSGGMENQKLKAPVE